jgi:hypothetical protein
MQLPKLQKPDKYVGLYVFDFGDHAGVGFTAEEVAELLDSEKFKDGKVYKIHRAYPDGTMELKGVRTENFQLEAGMFFYADNPQTAQADYKKLISLAVRSAPPCRAKVHLAEYGIDKYAVAVIYPAEYDDEISAWLLAGDYKTSGAVEGGIGAVQRYYEERPTLLERHQLFAKSAIESRTGQELLAHVKMAVQR